MRKSDLSAAQSDAPASNSRFPEGLPTSMRTMYRRCVAHLQAGGKFRADTDTRLLVIYLQTVDEIQRCREQIDAEGLTVVGSTGAVKPHPLLSHSNHLRITVGRLAGELGLSPASRIKLSTAGEAAKEKKPGDPWAAVGVHAPKKPAEKRVN